MDPMNPVIYDQHVFCATPLDVGLDPFATPLQLPTRVWGETRAGGWGEVIWDPQSGQLDFPRYRRICPYSVVLELASSFPRKCFPTQS